MHRNVRMMNERAFHPMSVVGLLERVSCDAEGDSFISVREDGF